MRLSSLISVLVFAGPLFADPPKVILPLEVKAEVGEWVFVEAETDGKAVEWIVPEGIKVFPPKFLNSTKLLACVSSKEGAFTVYAYSGNADGPSKPARCKLIFGKGVIKPPDDPKDPPVKTGKLFLMIVRPDGPATPDFLNVMGNPAWDEVRNAGHSVKDYPLSAMQNYKFPNGTVLPAVHRLEFTNPEKTKSRVLDTVAFPTNAEGIRKLMEVK